MANILRFGLLIYFQGIGWVKEQRIQAEIMPNTHNSFSKPFSPFEPEEDHQKDNQHHQHDDGIAKTMP
jgi:hypothetical protein